MILLDGVDYLSGHREELVHWAAAPGEAEAGRARAHLERFLADELSGIKRRLRAGWAAVRWLEVQDGVAAWRGPSYLFALEARTAGTFQVEAVGEDPSPWEAPDPGELPELPGAPG